MQYQTKSFCLKLMIIFSILVVLASNMISFSYAGPPVKTTHPSYPHLKVPTELTKPHTLETKTHGSGELAEEPAFKAYEKIWNQRIAED